MNALVRLLPVVLIALLPAGAAEPGIIGVLQRNYNENAAIYAEFEQSIYWVIREKTSRKKGTLSFAPGNRFRADVGDELFVSDGTTLWHHNRPAKQVVIRNAADLDLSAQPSHLLTSATTRYRFSERSSTGDRVTLSWNADSGDTGAYRAITLTVKEPDGVIMTLILTDVNMNIHTYTFKKTVFGKNAPPATFFHEAASDAAVIDHRR